MSSQGTNDHLDHGRFTLSISTDEGNTFTSKYVVIDFIKHRVGSEGHSTVSRFYRHISRSRCRWKSESNLGVVHIINFHSLELLKLFHFTLSLLCFGVLRFKPFYKPLLLCDVFLLIIKCSLLLINAFGSQLHEFRVTNFIVINLTLNDFRSSIRDVI